MKKSYLDRSWGLNTMNRLLIGNKDFVEAKNVFYNSSGQIQTRRGYRKFGNEIDANPITSYFFYQRDDTLDRIAICFSGSNAWMYDESTGDWNSIKTGRIEYETIPALSANRTRWDFTTYKNVIYMCNGVNNYMWYSWGSATTIYWDWPPKYWGSWDHTNDRFLLWAYPLTVWDEVRFETSGAMPAGLVEFQWYYVTEWDGSTYIKLSSTPWWDVITFSDNGSGTVTYYELEMPRFRYVQYLGDRIYGAGDYNAATTLYYSNALPTNWTSINTNAAVVWGDETGYITGMQEYEQSVLVFKNTKIYLADVANTSIKWVDAEWWGRSDRSIQSVANSLAYLSDRGIETLRKRDGVSGASAIDNRPLSDKIRSAFDAVRQENRYATVWWNIRETNSYYVSIDANNDNIPDSTYVYSSLNGWRTQYTWFPNIYDYWYYIDDEGKYRYLFASGDWGQMYEFEYGFDDDGVDIDCQILTNRISFWDAWEMYEFTYVDVMWWKQEGSDIDLTVYSDWQPVWYGVVTDAMLDLNSTSPVTITPVWVDKTQIDEWVDWITLYQYRARVQFYTIWHDIQLGLHSEWVQRIFEWMTVNVNWQPQEVNVYSHIA